MDKRKIYSIYSEILDLPREDHADALNRLCGLDGELRAEVQSLLTAAQRPASELDAQFDSIRNEYWRDVTGEDAEKDEDLSGRTFGIWQLDSQIGRGGIATVYLAHRVDGEFNQRVAFKVMRRGLDTDDLIARFRAEREILAALDHPGIARILDGGTLPDGRPYLVLEFVDGTHIVDYATEHALDTRARLGLLREVAAALQHAHQHLVVHRDVKPSNVMVASDGAVRLLDFGIAKILDPSTSPIASRLTKTGVAMLTPAYGSPELFGTAPVTTGSDIYQLGLLTAELLTGDKPRTPRGEPPTPAVERIHNRDLLAIVQKATRDAAADRYASAREFDADLERFLSDKPVTARADSWLYRTGKFMKRRPLLVPLAVGVLVTAAVYVVTITSYSREVERERGIAEETQAFMTRLFESPNPRSPANPERGRSITVVEALDIGKQKVLDELSDQPELQASLSRTISSVYEALDQYRPAIELRQRALTLEEQWYGPDSSRALTSMRALARLNLKTGDLDGAASMIQRQLDIASHLPGAERGMAEHAAGLQALELGDEQQAAELLEDALTHLLAEQGLDDKIDTAKIVSLLEQAASTGTSLSSVEAAEEMALDTLGADSPAGLVLRARIAAAMTNIGEYRAAETRYLALLPDMEAQFGPQHPDTLSTRNNLGYLYASWDKQPEAEAIHADLLQRNLIVAGPTSQAVAYNYQNLATSVARQGRYDEALDLHQQALETFAAVFDEDHYLTALPLLSMAYIYLELAEPIDAERQARAALTRLEASQPDTYLVGIARCLVGTAQIRQDIEQGSDLVESGRSLMNHIRVPDIYAELCGVTQN